MIGSLATNLAIPWFPSFNSTLPRRLVLFLFAIVLFFPVAKSEAASTEINVCNKGGVRVFIAFYKTYFIKSPVRGWYSLRPGDCRLIHSETVTTGLFSSLDGARVNLAFAVLDANGKAWPYVGDFGYNPSDKSGSPKTLCLPPPRFPRPTNDAQPLYSSFLNGYEFEVDDDFGSKYIPPCQEGRIPIPVSFSAYIQGDYHLTLDLKPSLAEGSDSSSAIKSLPPVLAKV